LASYLPKPHADGSPIQPSEFPTALPAYLIRVVAQLKVEGQVVASGGSYPLGQELVGVGGFTRYDLSDWDLSTDGTIISGQTSAIGLSLQGISGDQMARLKARLESTKAKLEAKDVTGLTGDLIIGDFLTATVWGYFTSVETYGNMAKRQADMIDLPALSYGFFHAAVVPNRLYGIITTNVRFPGVMMDIGHLRHNRVAKDNETQSWITYNQMRGQQASMLEGTIPETFFTDPNAVAKPEAVSAVKAIAVAAAQGQKIFTITQANAAVALPQLQQRASVVDEIQNAVAAGKEVTISQSRVTVGGWTGAGYTIVDPATGAGAYMIEGGANGGFMPVGALWGVSFAIPVMAILFALGATASLFLIFSTVIIALTVLMLLSIALADAMLDLNDTQRGCVWNGFAQSFTLTISAYFARSGPWTSVIAGGIVGWFLSHLPTTPSGQC